MLINMAKKAVKKPVQIVLTEEQTILSRERTMLSHIRTGLAFIGAGLIVVKFFSQVYYQGVGILLMIIGFFEVISSYKKLYDYNKKIKCLKKYVKKNIIDDLE